MAKVQVWRCTGWTEQFNAGEGLRRATAKAMGDFNLTRLDEPPMEVDEEEVDGDGIWPRKGIEWPPGSANAIAATMTT